MLKVGILGCGGIAEKHVRAWQSLKNVTVKSVCDLNIELAKEFAHKWGVTTYYGNFTSMLESENLSVLSVCTPPSVRSKVVIPAIEKGVHVFIEKPFALTVEEADRMLEAAKNHGVKISAAHSFLWTPVVMSALSILKTGKIGALAGVDIRFVSDGKDPMTINKDHWCHKIPGGRLGEALPHAIYLALAFLEDLEIVDVFATRLGKYPWMRFDEHRIILKSTKGPFVTISSTFNTARRSIYLDLYGSKGIIQMDLRNLSIVKREYRNPEFMARVWLDNINFSIQNITSFLRHLLRLIKQPNPHKLIIERLANSILKDNKPPVTEYEIRETVRICENICNKIEESH